MTRRGMCIGCHRPQVIVRRGRCAACIKPLDATENTERRKVYDSEWRKLSARTLAKHRLEHGNWCPVCGDAPADLTVDHILARSLEHGVQVCCRSCNSSKGNR